MATSYIPRPDALALNWMQVFALGIQANPALFMLLASDAAAISAAVDLFAAAFAVANDPATRTPVSVNSKDVARNSAEQICRQYAVLIKNNAGVSDSDKISIGVRPVNPSRSPVNVPESSPLLNIIGATPGAHTVRYADTNTPDKAAKPFGAVQLQLFVAVGTGPVADPSAAAFHGAFTKNPVGVAFDAADDGKVATYFGRWASRTGEVGPWSLPVSMRIAA
jgi:hypothetical protein